MILIFILYAVLALTFVLAQKAVMVCSPLFFVAIRMTIAGALLLLYAKLRAQQCGDSVVPKRKDWHLFGLVMLLHIYFAFTLEFWALKEVSALKANFLYALTPFIACVVDRVFVRKSDGLIRLLGIVIGFCGLIPLFGIHAQSYAQIVDFAVTAPDVALLCSIVSATVAWFFIKVLLNKDYSILVINGWSMLGGGLLSSITSLCCEQIYIVDVRMFLWCLVSLIVLSNGVMYTLYGFLVKRYSLTLITTAGFLCPLFGLLYDWLLHGAVPNILYIPAFVCIMFGLLLVYAHE